MINWTHTISARAHRVGELAATQVVRSRQLCLMGFARMIPIVIEDSGRGERAFDILFPVCGIESDHFSSERPSPSESANGSCPILVAEFFSCKRSPDKRHTTSTSIPTGWILSTTVSVLFNTMPAIKPDVSHCMCRLAAQLERAFSASHAGAARQAQQPATHSRIMIAPHPPRGARSGRPSQRHPHSAPIEITLSKTTEPGAGSYAIRATACHGSSRDRTVPFMSPREEAVTTD